MKYYYLNKIAMAVLVALLLFFGTRTIIDIAYQEHPPEKPGFEVAGTEDEGHGKEEKATDEGAEFILALNKADPAKGEQDVRPLQGVPQLRQGRAHDDWPEPLRRRRSQDRVS